MSCNQLAPRGPWGNVPQMVCRPVAGGYVPSTAQSCSIPQHTEFPGSFQGCCFSVACSLCHKHKQERGISALALAAPALLGIQEMENAMVAGKEPPHTQITNRHKPCMSALYSFPTPFLCSLFYFTYRGINWHRSWLGTFPVRIRCQESRVTFFMPLPCALTPPATWKDTGRCLCLPLFLLSVTLQWFAVGVMCL